MKKRELPSPAIGLILLLCLGFLFVPECDDCYFIYWDYASWKDFLLTRPIPDPGVVLGVPANGRYLGNLAGVLLGKLYAWPILRGLTMGGMLAAMVWLLSAQRKGLSRREGLLLALSLVVLAPRGLWQQVCSWGAGMGNYLLPMVCVLLMMKWLEGEKRPALLFALTAFAAALCMETVTIWLAAAAAALFVLRLRKGQGRGEAAALLLGALAGAVCMAAAPGYGQVGSGGDQRSLALALVWDNLPAVVTETLVLPAAVTALISFLLVWLLRRRGRGCWRGFAAALIPLHLFCFWSWAGDLRLTFSRYTPLTTLAGLLLAGLWAALLVLLRERGKLAALALSLCVLNGPVLLLGMVRPRNFFPGYVVLCVVALRLYGQARAEGLSLRSLKCLYCAAAIALVAVAGIYWRNGKVYDARLELARVQVQAGQTELTLPLVPYPGWTVNELPGKGDLSYLVYREKPWDVAFAFVPYERWEDG